MTDAVSSDQLKQIIEQIEAINARIDEETDWRNKLYAAAKAQGYDIRALRTLVTLRKQRPDNLAEFEAILDLYRSAVGV